MKSNISIEQLKQLTVGQIKKLTEEIKNGY